MTRICPECKKPLPAEDDWLNSKSFDGRKYSCQDCLTRRVKKIRESKSQNKSKEDNKNGTTKNRPR